MKAMFCTKLNFKLRQLYTWRHCEEAGCLSWEEDIGDGLRGRVFVRGGVVTVTGEGVRAYTRAGAGTELAQGKSW